MVRFFRRYGLERIFHQSSRNSMLDRLCVMWAMNFAHDSSGGSGGSYEKYSWEGVFASIDAGTYATDYAIGDMIPLDLGSEGVVNMQIAAFDTDDLADGSGKAPITWIAKELLKTAIRKNPPIYQNADGTYKEGTGAVGGWEKCEMRSYLKNTIKPLIPENVRSAIKAVTKTQPAIDTSEAKFTETTTEDVWIPSVGEVITIATRYPLYNDNSHLLKYLPGATSRSKWWLRSADYRQSFNFVDGRSYNNDYANSKYWVCLCFCT